MIVETNIIHGGDLIEWRDNSGFVDKGFEAISPSALDIQFSQAPRSMRVVQKAKGTLLWHSSSAGPSRIVSGQATEEEVTAHPSKTFLIEGSVSDPTGRYLPRAFSFTLGNTAQHKVGLYRSPLGSNISKSGGIYGQISFDDNRIAAWALIELTVTPSVGTPLPFVAQADAYGEFCLPLNRLPALTKDAPSPTYSAVLTVKASTFANPDHLLNPDTLPSIQIAHEKDSNGISQFANSIDLAIAPGKVTKVVSPKHTRIVLKST